MITLKYYKLPLGSIPFKELPSLEETVAEFAYCTMFSIIDLMESDFNLLSVYDIFEKDLQIQDFQDKELLFGEVISESLPSRGKAKCIKLGSIEKDIRAESLPHLNIVQVINGGI